jgi:endonuclease/exonuclease/phosphatase family metal-dependent hydrolase
VNSALSAVKVRVPQIRVMTFNVRYDTEEDGAHDWRHRRADALELIQTHDPDLIALQEPDTSQWADIAAHLPDHTPFAVLDAGFGNTEAYGGFFRAGRFQCEGEGVFWLSDTPEVPHSVTWENDWEPRACGWVRLRDRMTDRPLVFAATHFDTNPHAWLPSAKVLHRELQTIASGAPTIVAGDFNCRAGSKAHRYLITEGGFRDVWYDAGQTDAGVLTFHGFTGRRNLPAAGNERIDWILVRGELTAGDATIDYSSSSGEPASDHYPVIAWLDWRSSSLDL